MGTTAIHLLPYPELTEPADVPADTKELADRIEAIFGTLATAAWVTIGTFTNSWVADVPAPQYRRELGGVVRMRGAIRTGTMNQAAFTLPAGFRPPANVWLPCYSWNGTANTLAVMLIAPSGAVTPSSPGANNSFVIAGSFAAV